ncbi:tRNA (adenosine(37)-N6)-threonylcarbamoyltransferase complex dimerization subunit type 1 TsaB [uncultured Peptoniphilus sp.]|uniref:tRNA (adenosine(37)-N6)-threonylcarbamoyltransferase complex dimerization subunit type 1 TsaB n=1 Tax=uncultured Peptoniphilus sp. TaxID=254354 RepID=UPI0028047AEA|nr:tRNA (adenosine(37)-N6)-threonylcarbamoyltransferase complex dimerization subunit type 1 TsaB [uncultured Peptoniphilus sp.]
MKILALDTSTRTTSLALTEDENVLGLFSLTGSVYHSESIDAMIRDIFEKFDFDINDIDLIGVGIGPGSFTGIRIGLSFAKVLAQVLKKDIVSVSSLDAPALREEGLVAPLIDARRGLVYASLIENREDFKIILPDQIISIEEFSKIVGNREVTLQGVDCPKFLGYFQKARAGKFLQMDAKYIAALALKKYKEEGAEDFYKLVPNYLKLSQAENNYANRNKKSF